MTMMRDPAHLVISDFHMPKMNGVELLRAVRAMFRLASPPFFSHGRGGRRVSEARHAAAGEQLPEEAGFGAELRKKIEAVFGVLQ